MTDITERLDELLRWMHYMQTSTDADDQTRLADARDAVFTEIQRMNTRIAELEEIAYVQTSDGPKTWKELWQHEVDQNEFLRSSASPMGEVITELRRENAELKGLLEE